MIFNDKELKELIETNKASLKELNDSIASINDRLTQIEDAIGKLQQSNEDSSNLISDSSKNIELIQNAADSTRKEVDAIRDRLTQYDWVAEKGRKEFADFMFEKNLTDYNDYCMANETQWKTRVNDVKIVLPNAKVGKVYETSFQIPTDIATVLEMVKTEEIRGLDFKYEKDTGTCYIGGIPENPGDFVITLKYIYPGWNEDRPVLERTIPISINPDPRSLWLNIDTKEDIDYFQPDSESDYVKVEAKDGEPQKDIVVASVRGRSHAHKGSPRDDHYKVMYNAENRWYIIAVADGAGSAKYSRAGSTIACNTVVDICKEGVKDTTLEDAIRAYSADRSDDNKKVVGDKIYAILANAALKAGKAITEEAARKDAELKAKNSDQQNTPVSSGEITDHDYATTLLLAICKKFEFGWFVATFWVGDGAICIYNKEKGFAKLMGIPDSGEQAGQTVFLTMKKVVFKDAATIYSRLRFQIEEDFDALFLMTDGVSDPKFETDANLNDINMWNKFWDDLKGNNDDTCEVRLEDDNEDSKNELLKWLEFYTDGHHDDRTLAILY